MFTLSAVADTVGECLQMALRVICCDAMTCRLLRQSGPSSALFGFMSSRPDVAMSRNTGCPACARRNEPGFRACSDWIESDRVLSELGADRLERRLVDLVLEHLLSVRTAIARGSISNSIGNERFKQARCR